MYNGKVKKLLNTCTSDLATSTMAIERVRDITDHFSLLTHACGVVMDQRTDYGPAYLEWGVVIGMLNSTRQTYDPLVVVSIPPPIYSHIPSLVH